MLKVSYLYCGVAYSNEYLVRIVIVERIEPR
jgi:hypothetical protein